jgi:hypothetical protein
MIELSMKEFYKDEFKADNYCLYMVRNGESDLLYIGISSDSIWNRWFGGSFSHIPHGKYPNSLIGQKIFDHLPDSGNWKIQLWTPADCVKACKKFSDKSQYKLIRPNNMRYMEKFLIEHLRPILNRTHNDNPSIDTTPKSKSELERERRQLKTSIDVFG